MAHKLLAMMQRRGISSQAELAKLSGVPQPMISNIITGKTKDPQVSTMTKLAKALRCAVEDLTDLDEERGVTPWRTRKS